MSGNLRLCFASFALVGILSTTPASSNPFADLLNIAPREPAAAAPSAQAECLGRPGNSPPDGQHWVYRIDGHRKCWFLAEGIATVKKPVRHRVAKDRIARPDENETARRRRSAVVDARAELPRSSAPAEGSQPTSPTYEVTITDAASDLATGTVPLIPAAPVGDPPSGQLTPEHSVQRQVDVEKLLSTAPAVNDAVTSAVPSIMPIGARIADALDEGPSWTATWLGVLLMALGVISVLSSSRALREAVGLHH